MTITLSTQELFQFQEELQKWYNERNLYILKNIWDTPARPDRHLGFQQRPTSDDIYKHAEAFAKAHPKPNWQDLLAQVGAR